MDKKVKTKICNVNNVWMCNLSFVLGKKESKENQYKNAIPKGAMNPSMIHMDNKLGEIPKLIYKHNLK